MIIEEGLATGYIQPGKIFQTIENSFEGCVSGTYIDRAWIDNLWRWERECPSAKEDQTFGQTLIEYLRKRRVTTLVTCRDLEGATEELEKGILDSANVHIRLWRDDLAEKSCLLMRVVKTRGMNHHRETYVVDFQGDDELSIHQTWQEANQAAQKRLDR